MEAEIRFGLKPKIYVNQFHSIDGIQAGIKHNALSVDYLEMMKQEDINALKNSETMPVILPSCLRIQSFKKHKFRGFYSLHPNENNSQRSHKYRHN